MLKTISHLLLVAALGVAAVQPVDARRGSDQTDMRAQQSAGEVMKTSQIENIVLPRMRGMQYLGPAYDSRSQIYTLKFMNRDRVIFVEVDGRTGSVLRQR